MTEQHPFRKDDVVMLKTGNVKMSVVSVAGDQIQCRYPGRIMPENYRPASDYKLIQAYGSSPKT